MKTITRSFICALLVALAAGCGPQPYENREGFTNEDFREEAVKLNLSMNREEVDSLIGQPDETAIKTSSDGDDKKTWRMLEWRYRWIDKDLILIFRKLLDDEWRLHSWGWQVTDSRI
ncbi:MAG: hypothetical protein OXU34_00460 [Gammaproteobacteria bacterium]|nr:hypothetical protein [Gammaproteobacteria bacterium]